MPNELGDIVLYQTEDGKTSLEVQLQDDTIWMSQAQLSELFQKDVRTINEHLKTIFKDGELKEDSTIRKFRIVRKDGMRGNSLSCWGSLKVKGRLDPFLTLSIKPCESLTVLQPLVVATTSTRPTRPFIVCFAMA